MPTSVMTSVLLLQASAPSPLAGGLGLFVQMGVVMLIMYLLLIAPMRKKQRKLAESIEALKKGDRVVTSGGIYGTVAAVEGATVQLKIADQVKVKVAKSAITTIESNGVVEESKA